jgi:molybdenum-dependent DNA-binding transcriptional regulator ModE
MKLIEDLLAREMLVEEQNGGSWKRTFALTQSGRIWLQNFDAVYDQLHDLSIQLQTQQATNSSS